MLGEADATAMLEIAGEKFKLDPGHLYLLGRKEGTKISAMLDIALESESLDPKHAMLEYSNGSVIVIDLKSEMGTFLDNRRLEAMQKVTISSTSTLSFGEVEGQVSLPLKESDNSSGFLEGPKNVTDTTNILEQSADVSGFLGGNSTRHSFTIPETQFVKPSSRASTTRSDMSHNDSTNEDFFIPETQEMTATISCSQKPKISNPNISKNIFETDELESSESQFRICTEDYNENCFGEEVDLDSFDSSRDVQCSLVIPHIQHKPVLLGEQESVRKQSESVIDVPETSNCTTLNDSKEDNEADRATPDMDFPEMADEILGNVDVDTLTQNADDTVFNSNIGVPQAEALSSDKRRDLKTQPKRAAPVPLDEEEDLMPTQVFKPRPKKQDKPVLEYTQEYLTLSDKENMLPCAAAALLETAVEVEENQPTQIFEASAATRSEVNRSIKAKTPPSVNADKMAEEPSAHHDETLACTQVFLVSKKKKTEASTSHAKAKNGLSSTLLTAAEQEIPAAFEKTQHKAIEEFKKPGSGSLVRKTSSMRSETSTVDSESMEIMTCTPQLIKDGFFKLTADANSGIAAKKITLFGDDSDEDEDVLNLITNPEVNSIFDTLIPNLKAQPNAQPPPQVKEIKRQFLIAFGEKETKAVDKSKSSNRSRDARHAARSETSRKEKSDDRLAACTSKNSRGAGKREKSEDHLVDRKSKKTDEEMVVSKKKEKERKTENQLVAKKNGNDDEEMVVSKKNEKPNDQSSSSRNRKRKLADEITAELKPSSSRTKEPELPAKRITRQQSRAEDMSMDDKSKEIETKSKATHESEGQSNSQKKQKATSSRRTRLQTHTESQESGSSSKTDKSKSNGDLGAKKENIRQRLRSTSSRSDLNSGNSSVKLKVSMTTVDPELFESLAKKSADIWTIANDPTESDILVMDQGVRTFKFLVAMAKGIPIVTAKWLKCVNQNKCVVDMKQHFFADADFEKRHKFSLIKSLQKARKRKLFEGFEFLMTPDIHPTSSEMRAIINCSGGKVHIDTPPAYKDNQKLYLISSANDKKYWHQYRRLNSNICIISTEGVMTAVIRQRAEQLDKYLLA